MVVVEVSETRPPTARGRGSEGGAADDGGAGSEGGVAGDCGWGIKGVTIGLRAR